MSFIKALNLKFIDVLELVKNRCIELEKHEYDIFSVSIDSDLSWRIDVFDRYSNLKIFDIGRECNAHHSFLFNDWFAATSEGRYQKYRIIEILRRTSDYSEFSLNLHFKGQSEKLVIKSGLIYRDTFTGEIMSGHKALIYIARCLDSMIDFNLEATT